MNPRRVESETRFSGASVRVAAGEHGDDGDVSPTSRHVAVAVHEGEPCTNSIRAPKPEAPPDQQRVERGKAQREQRQRVEPRKCWALSQGRSERMLEGSTAIRK